MSVSRRRDDPSVIYKITHIASGRVYIGFTQVSLSRRWSAHLSTAKRSDSPTTPLSRALKKYGREAFAIELVYEATNQREGIAVERALIAAYGTLAPRGFNLCIGGEGTGGYQRIHTQETKQRISVALTGKTQTEETKQKRIIKRLGIALPASTRQKIALANTGKRHSMAARHKMSDARRGRKPRPETVEKQRLALTGRVFSETHRQRLSEAASRREAERRSHR